MLCWLYCFYQWIQYGYHKNIQSLGKYIMVIIIIIMSILPKGRSFTANSGTHVAVLLHFTWSILFYHIV